MYGKDIANISGNSITFSDYKFDQYQSVIKKMLADFFRDVPEYTALAPTEIQEKIARFMNLIGG